MANVNVYLNVKQNRLLITEQIMSKSFSLGMDSDPGDTQRAMTQIMGYEYFELADNME